MKQERWSKMNDNLQSKFQQDLQKFKHEINKRKEKIKKFDEFMSSIKEKNEFKFLRLRQKREQTKKNTDFKS